MDKTIRNYKYGIKRVKAKKARRFASQKRKRTTKQLWTISESVFCDFWLLLEWESDAASTALCMSASFRYRMSMFCSKGGRNSRFIACTSRAAVDHFTKLHHERPRTLFERSTTVSERSSGKILKSNLVTAKGNLYMYRLPSHACTNLHQ